MTSRREFLRRGVQGAGALYLTRLLPIRAKFAHAQTKLPKAPSPNVFEDAYRSRWTWDRIEKGTHGWLNCASACEFDLYIKNGLIVREEQTAAYEPVRSDVPDFNPRGCNKGSCFTNLVYSSSRPIHPLRRAGDRGKNRWNRASWDEAVTDIARRLLDIIEKDGAECIIHDLGPHFDVGPTTAARVRFFNLLGATLLDSWGEIGDLSYGAALTMGITHVGGTSDNWYLSDFIVLWNFNPSVTRIPDAHFLWEAQYRGSTVVSISPEQNASSIHADYWINPKPGTDAALALAMAHVMIEEKLINRDFIAEQTDLPFLVDPATGTFLRKEGQDVYYVWDAPSGNPIETPGSKASEERTLRWRGQQPVLEGEWDWEGRHITTVFTLLKRELARWTPEQAHSITGIHPDTIRSLARRFAGAKSALIISSWGANRYYHSDLMIRSRILLAALTGNIGRPGGGFDVIGWFPVEGFEFLCAAEDAGLRGSMGMMMQKKDLGRNLFRIATGRQTVAEFLYAFQKEHFEGRPLTFNSTFNYAHGGLREVLNRKEYHDPSYRKSMDDIFKEAAERGETPVYPALSKTPRAWFTGGNNVLRRTGDYPVLLEKLWPKLDLVVDVNFKMTFTGMWSDYVLPAATPYEKVTLKYPISYVPYLHFSSRVVSPLGESKSEWEIYSLLARAIQEEARRRGNMKYSDFHDRFSFGGRFGPGEEEKVCQEILTLTYSTMGTTVKEMKRKGIKRFRNSMFVSYHAQTHSDLRRDQPLSPCQDFTLHKKPWPTATGRVQFLIDQGRFREVGESLPTFKPPVNAGGRFPFRLTSGHTRWSIHSIWRDDPVLLRLQRGVPLLYISAEDAARKHIQDFGLVRVFNELGSFEIHAKVSPQLQPGQLFLFHAWEPYQFKRHRSYKSIQPGMIKPLHFTGRWGHLHQIMGQAQPGQHVNDTLCDFESA
ncbi:MAG: molybdopterin-dependent oxidoreductase [Nitrospirae bacterium]|nr:molybdopterin-dependent oxidoreductase [Nitrospirota bacterium]